jgi:hypothetical protein
VRWRSLIALIALGAAAAVLPLAAAQSEDAGPMTVLVVVVDGLNPEEVNPTTPALSSLREQGTWWDEARSVLIAETIPNHVAMMTGVTPARSGIPANAYWDRSSDGPETMGDAELILAETLFTTLGERCPDLGTAAVLSKDYLYTIFLESSRNRIPDSTWDPRPTNIPGSGHSPDVVSMTEVLGRLPDADFMFVNLGDVDRSGHVDFTGGLPLPADVLDQIGEASDDLVTNIALARQAVLRSTDLQVGLLVETLRAEGRWDRTVLFVVSDHGMDWSPVLGYINTAPTLEALAPGRFVIAQNGGADTIYLRDADAPDAPALLAAARAALVADERIEHAWYRVPNPVDPAPGSVVPAHLGLDTERSGDLILMARPGWRFSDPDVHSNPIPGNHGHLITRHNTFLIAGGHPAVRQGQVVAASQPGADELTLLPEQASNMDVAPTVAWLLGLPTDGYDGRALTEAFTTEASPTVCGQAVSAPLQGDGPSGPDGAAEGPGAAPAPTLPATGTPVPLGVAAALGIAALALGTLRRRHP